MSIEVYRKPDKEVMKRKNYGEHIPSFTPRFNYSYAGRYSLIMKRSMRLQRRYKRDTKQNVIWRYN